MEYKYIIYLTFALLSLITDTFFALGRYPIFFVSVCVIVVVYELVSPYIYTSR